MDGDWFDQLSRFLGRGVNRRSAVAALAALAVGGAEEAAAKHKHKRQGRAAGGNSACAKFCAQVFGVDTPAAGKCTSDAAHGTGLCATCGTAAPTDICCIRNSAGFCTDYSAVCPCASGQTCVSGSCQSVTPNVCAGKYSPNPCYELSADTCGTTPGGRSCRCGTDIKGNPACYENAYCVNPVTEGACESNADCVNKFFFPAGSVCFSAPDCCPSAPGVPPTGCTTPCPPQSA